jgi:hypothetical protein
LFFCFILHHIDELISKKIFFCSSLCIFNTHCWVSIEFSLTFVMLKFILFFSALRMVVKIDKTVFMNCFFYIRLQKKFIFGFCFLASIRKTNYKQRKLLYLYVFLSLVMCVIL